MFYIGNCVDFLHVGLGQRYTGIITERRISATGESLYQIQTNSNLYFPVYERDIVGLADDTKMFEETNDLSDNSGLIEWLTI